MDEATLNAAVCAVGNNFDTDNHRFQIILAGGDDLIIAVPADRAMDVAVDFCNDFNQKVAQYDLTTSASIVICHDSLPIKNILETEL